MLHPATKEIKSCVKLQGHVVRQINLSITQATLYEKRNTKYSLNDTLKIYSRFRDFLEITKYRIKIKSGMCL